jgi:uncharacterized iron-regulated membrane protein
MGQLFRKIHLWLGLTSGILIFLICISGAFYAFKEELFQAIHHDQLYNANTNEIAQPLPLNELWENAQKGLGEEYPISYGTCYKDKNRNWSFKAYHYDSEGVTYNQWLKYDYIAYVNPYSGEVVDVMNHKWEFFHLVKMFHWSFLLNTEYGQPIVAFTVVVFLISLLTGLYLWWPFRKGKKGYAINTRSSGKVLNYDLHNVLGFYMLPVNIILSLTGMVWAFKWFMMLVYAVANLSTAPPEKVAVASAFDDQQFRPQTYSTVYQQVRKEHTEAYSVNVYPASPDSAGVIRVFVKNESSVYYQAYQEQYDKYSGELLHSKGFADLSRGEKLIAMNYDIHTGAVLGKTGKILAFIAALIGASLPVTGFIIWYKKRRKSKQQRLRLSTRLSDS